MVDWFEDKARCVRCGVAWVVSAEKRRQQNIKCSSCKATPAKTISYGHRKPCVPHHGEFDQFDNPIVNGHALSGATICSHSDCTEMSHRSGGTSKTS
jgi:hypothetical protein